jgi:hypothetical protein
VWKYIVVFTNLCRERDNTYLASYKLRKTVRYMCIGLCTSDKDLLFTTYTLQIEGYTYAH